MKYNLEISTQRTAVDFAGAGMDVFEHPFGMSLLPLNEFRPEFCTALTYAPKLVFQKSPCFLYLKAVEIWYPKKS